MGRRTAEWILLVVSVAIAIGAAEVVLAVFFPQRTVTRTLHDEPPVYRDSAITDYELIPGFEGRHRRREFDVAIRVNSLGYRQGEFRAEKNGQKRIVIVGDSFTFGWGVEAEEAYPLRIEQLLREERPLETFEVVNAGFAAGFFPDAYYLYLKERGLDLDPDLVMVGFYLKNDIDGAAARTRVWKRVDESGLPLQVDSSDQHNVDGYRIRKHRKWRWRLPLIRDSHLAQLVLDSVKAVRKRTQPEDHLRGRDRWVFDDPWSETTQENAERVKRLFVAMADLCRARSVPFVVILIPARMQIYDEPYRSLEGLDLGKPQHEFARFFDEQGIDYVDLTAAMRSARADPIYYEIDSHWTARGHAVAARAVVDYLLAEGVFEAAAGAP